MKSTLITLLAIFTLNVSKAQVQTIIVSSTSPTTNNTYLGQTLTIPANNYAKLMSLTGPNAQLQITSQGMTVPYNNNTVSLADYPVVIAGPATIQIDQSNVSPIGAFATFDVEPAPFPPNKTATIGANAGNVQVTMQTSTDLVNWTSAVNGQTYTNSPDARFFRIQMLTNVGP
jgi:hypothetical protein